MSFNSAAYLAYEQRRMEPDSVIVTGTRRRHTPAWVEKNKFFDSLTDDQLEQLRREHEERYKNYDE